MSKLSEGVEAGCSNVNLYINFPIWAVRLPVLKENT